MKMATNKLVFLKVIPFKNIWLENDHKTPQKKSVSSIAVSNIQAASMNKKIQKLTDAKKISNQQMF